MNYVIGALLIALGLCVIAFGDRAVTAKSGVLLKSMGMPRLHVSFAKWAAGLLFIWFGLAFILDAI